MRVAVGSQNPSKIGAVRTAFIKMGFDVEVIGVQAASGVASQPFSDDETMQGAVNRAKHVMNQLDGENVDYAVGLEGGVVETAYGLFVCNWGAVVNRAGTVGVGAGSKVQLPPVIAEALHRGEELGAIIDEWAGGRDIKKKEGTIGILTANHITRVTMFRDVVICAFSRFLHPEYYTHTANPSPNLLTDHE